MVLPPCWVSAKVNTPGPGMFRSIDLLGSLRLPVGHATSQATDERPFESFTACLTTCVKDG
jgi:hypothetical protein